MTCEIGKQNVWRVLGGKEDFWLVTQKKKKKKREVDGGGDFGFRPGNMSGVLSEDKFCKEKLLFPFFI